MSLSASISCSANCRSTVRRGEIVCVVGPSGCGKTTALRVASGLIPPTRGDVAFAGAPIRGPRRDVAIVFQDYAKALLPWRTAAGNVALALEAMGTRRGRAPRPRRRAARSASASPPRRQVPVADVWRHAAKTADRAMSRAGARRADDGRAVRRARRDDAPDAPGRDARDRAEHAARRSSSSPTISRRRSISATA